ncbi:MAG: hypothetical protein IJ766_02110 [Clostridia bacterium]|nr:hypothetical protein [Clostridia bacterium]
MKKVSTTMIALLMTLLLLGQQAVMTAVAAEEYGSTAPEITTVPDEPSTVAPSRILGDVDGNGKVQSKDARMALRAVARLITLTDIEKSAADFDENGRLTAADARYILRVAARLDPFAPPTTLPPTTVPSTTKAPTTVPPTTAKPKPVDTGRKFTKAVSNAFYTDQAYAAALYDYDNDKILYDRNMDAYVEPVSTTKVMTAYVASKYLKPESVITVGSEMDLVNWNASRAGIYRGVKMTFSEMLKCLLLPSGCDAAYAIACAAGRAAAKNNSLSARDAVNKFVSLMNSEAKKLGMTRTTWTNPDGFPDSGNRPYTTAHDMLLVAVAAYGVKVIRDTVCLPNATVYDYYGNRFGYYSNTNELLWKNSSRYYPYCIGMKTGSHSSAGQCLVAVAKKGNRTFFCVVMGCKDKTARYNALSNLFNTAFSKIK